jgi:hypothetical protein
VGWKVQEGEGERARGCGGGRGGKGRKAKRSERERGEVRGWEQKSALGSRGGERDRGVFSSLPFATRAAHPVSSAASCHATPLRFLKWHGTARHGRLLILPCLPRHSYSSG